MLSGTYYTQNYASIIGWPLEIRPTTKQVHSLPILYHMPVTVIVHSVSYKVPFILMKSTTKFLYGTKKLISIILKTLEQFFLKKSLKIKLFNVYSCSS